MLLLSSDAGPKGLAWLECQLHAAVPAAIIIQYYRCHLTQVYKDWPCWNVGYTHVPGIDLGQKFPGEMRRRHGEACRPHHS